MKIINLFKYFVIILLLGITPLFLCAEEIPAGKKEFPYRFASGTCLGMLYGDSFEIVYRSNSILLSELAWDLKPLFYMGTYLEFSRKNPLEKTGFYSKLSVKFGFPANTGSMEDRDWMAAGNGLSHFSSHTNYTNSSVLLDFSAGLTIPVFSAVIISPLLGFNFMHFSWTARDGYAQYGDAIIENVLYEPWDESLPRDQFYGPVVSYSQNWYIFSIGLSVKYPFPERFIIEGNFLFSPLIAVRALDDHYLRGTHGLQFWDEISGGFLIEPSLVFTFRLSEKMQLAARASYRYTDNSTGYSYAIDNSSGIAYSPSSAGAEYRVWDMGFSFAYSF